jgi:hypothetical protein
MDDPIVEREVDRSGDAIEDLRVRVGMARVAIPWPVGPAVDVVGLGAQPFLDTQR